MAYDYDSEENVAAREEMDEFAAEWIDEMQASGRLKVYTLGEDDLLND